jgi:hypothetical protein
LFALVGGRGFTGPPLYLPNLISVQLNKGI